MTDDEIADALDDGATLLVTDSNRNRGERWTTVRHTRGYTETAGEEPLSTDPTDNRLPTFPDAGRRRHDRGRRARRRRGPRHQLRQPDHVHERGAARAGGRRRPGDRVAHRGVLRRPRRAHRADPGRDHDDRPRHGSPSPPAAPATGSSPRCACASTAGDPIDVELGQESRDEPGQIVTFPTAHRSTRCRSRSWPTRRASCPATRASRASGSPRSRSATTRRCQDDAIVAADRPARRGRAPTTSTTPLALTMSRQRQDADRHDPPRRGAEHRAPDLAAVEPLVLGRRRRAAVPSPPVLRHRRGCSAGPTTGR